MARVSPTLEGFRAAFRRPSLTFAEIVWRWSVGATGIALFFFGLFEYFKTLPVTNGESLFLRTRQPFFIAQAIAHILRGSLARAVISAMVAGLMLVLLWIIAASLGRMATVRLLLEYFREDRSRRVAAGEVVAIEEEQGASETIRRGSLDALLNLNFLRAAVALAAGVGFIGAGVLVGFVSPSLKAQPGLLLLILLPLYVIIGFLWCGFNWLLSLASVFAVRDGRNTMSSTSEAVRFCRERTSAVFAVGTWTGLAHLALFVTATTVAAIPLGFVGLLPWRLIALGVVVLTLAYLAIADWLYVARLAGYVCILEMPEALLASPLPLAPPSIPPLQTTIDRDEPILSDVPGLLPETAPGI
jgi:hypothetical protein